VRVWLQANPQILLDDRSLLEEIGLKPHGRNVVEFGRAALTKLEAVVTREADARKQIETVARANFAAQTQTHVAALDLLEARNHSDLARRLDAAAQGRFGLAGAAIALEKPGGVPFGWRALEVGGVDALLGDHGLTWLGPNFEGLDLFGAADEQVKSVALIRMAPMFSRRSRRPGDRPGTAPATPSAPSARPTKRASRPGWAANWSPSSPGSSNARPNDGRSSTEAPPARSSSPGSSIWRTSGGCRPARWRPMAISDGTISASSNAIAASPSRWPTWEPSPPPRSAPIWPSAGVEITR
jgi:uncharacterized protein YigA (DUF484 family)